MKKRQTGYEFWLPDRRGVHVCILDGDQMKFRTTAKERAGGNGFGMAIENVSFTLSVRDRHMVGVFR